MREILRVRMAVTPVPENEANQVMTSQPEQQKIAYDVAVKSIVLLKNDGILPLNLDKKPVIAVIGENAVQHMASGGVGAGIKALYEVTPLEGLKNKIGDRAEIVYEQGYLPFVLDYARMFGRKDPKEIEKEDREQAILNAALNEKAVKTAAKADLVIFMGGDNRAVETEGSDRANITLPSGQDELIQKIAKVNPNIVTVLVSGAPNDLRTVQPLSNALVLSWFNGTEGGNALADVLVGNVSPSGRLPFTLPVKLEDSPAYALKNYPQGQKNADVFVGLVEETNSEITGEGEKIDLNDPNKAYYTEESLVGYRWFDTKNVDVMYPFGYGLTYTNFEYSGLSTDKDSYKSSDVIQVKFILKNLGEMTADEVVQVYVHRINPAVEWPFKELKAFKRETLETGSKKEILLEIPVGNLRYWNAEKQVWTDDLCDIELLVGASAGDIKLSKKVSLN
ncbi:MAG TPA: glycoside hydrolase family 3 C-terminal domain-containing protein [Bacteroidales bacterium]|nr:glycoside hydrolase family 3 C-terminal domain-containing protein [Bacteroidales bacterium]